MSDKEIREKLSSIKGFGSITRQDIEGLLNQIDSQAKEIELTVKALERIEGYWEANITVKTYARDALSAINRLSGE